MTIALDETVRIGPLKITALSETTVTIRKGTHSVLATGRKQPLAILICQSGTLKAYCPDGQPLSRSYVETLCPGAWQKAYAN